MSFEGELLFVVAAVIALGTAVATVTVRSPLRAAMALLGHVISLAGLFLTLHAELLAALQLLVYAGAVVVLFVFAIMLIGPSAQVQTGNRGMLVRTASAAGMAVAMAAIAFALVRFSLPYVATSTCEGDGCAGFGSVVGLGRALYTDGVVPFELVGVLLLVAILGAISVARGRTKKEADEARERKRVAQADEDKRREEEQRLSAEVSAHGGH